MCVSSEESIILIPQVTEEFAGKLAGMVCERRPTKSPYWEGGGENKAPQIGKGKRKRASSGEVRKTSKKPALAVRNSRSDSGDEFEPPSQSNTVRKPGLLPPPARRGRSL